MYPRPFPKVVSLLLVGPWLGCDEKRLACILMSRPLKTSSKGAELGWGPTCSWEIYFCPKFWFPTRKNPNK